MILRPRPVTHSIKLGFLYVEAGSLYHLIRGRWIPDGLHVWLGRYGVHLFWQRSPYARRITFDRRRRSGEGDS